MPLTISAQKGLINQYDYFDKQIASLNLSNYYIIQNGEFAYNKSYSNGYPYGAIKRLDYFEQGALSSLYICFSISNIDSDYLVKYFDSGKWNKQVKLISGEGARNHGLLNLSPDDFFNINIMISPSEEEQTKIAHFLNLINSKIKYMDGKIEALKKYRKGIQKIAFRRTPKEAYVKLKSLVLFMPKSKLSAGNSVENGKYPFYLSGEKIGTINSFMNDGCYIIANDGGEAGFRLSNGPFAYSDHCICFQSENEWTTRNLYEYLDSQKDRITYVGFLGSGLKNIDRAYLQNFGVPSTIGNKKLAILFSLLDEKIQNLENELVWLKAAKRYLLTNMFI